MNERNEAIQRDKERKVNASIRAAFSRDKSDRPIFCDTCGQTVMLYVFRQHLIEVHGYVNDNGQVFKRTFCCMCDKPALRHVGAKGFCKAHMEQATASRSAASLRYIEPRGRVFAKEWDATDKKLRERQSLHNVQKPHK